MSSKVYDASLPFSATDQELNRLFDAYGTVESALVIKDKFSGRSRGFGFVEMSTSREAVIAVSLCWPGGAGNETHHPRT